MTPPSNVLTIGEVAQRSGLRTSHIRFCERGGVLSEVDLDVRQIRARAATERAA